MVCLLCKKSCNQTWEQENFIDKPQRESLPALSAFLGTHSTASSTDSLTMSLDMQLLSLDSCGEKE